MANEKRLIDANDVLDRLAIEASYRATEYPVVSATLKATMMLVDSSPTVDAVEVVHGRWEDIYGGKYANPRFRCSVCKAKALYVNVLNGLGNWIDEQELSNYCPNCGAKMDGGN
jgi:hypothetical protein